MKMREQDFQMVVLRSIFFRLESRLPFDTYSKFMNYLEFNLVDRVQEIMFGDDSIQVRQRELVRLEHEVLRELNSFYAKNNLNPSEEFLSSSREFAENESFLASSSEDHSAAAPLQFPLEPPWEDPEGVSMPEPSKTSQKYGSFV